MRKLKNKQGFTLIELVVVMAIIAILAVLIIGAITIARHSATESANLSNARTIQTGLESYYSSNGQKYPTAFATKTSFNDATKSGAALANVSISNAACQDTTNTDAGGGNIVTVSSPSQGYTITVAKYDCSDGSTQLKSQ